MNDMHDDDDLTAAKLEKLRELKREIYRLVTEGEDDLGSLELAAAEGGEAAAGGEGDAEEGEALDPEAEALPGADDFEDPLLAAKRAYFKPKPPAPREGTGVFRAAQAAPPAKAPKKGPLK